MTEELLLLVHFHYDYCILNFLRVHKKPQMCEHNLVMDYQSFDCYDDLSLLHLLHNIVLIHLCPRRVLRLHDVHIYHLSDYIDSIRLFY